MSKTTKLAKAKGKCREGQVKVVKGGSVNLMKSLAKPPSGPAGTTKYTPTKHVENIRIKPKTTSIDVQELSKKPTSISIDIEVMTKKKAFIDMEVIH
jgi:hypothetical protein